MTTEESTKSVEEVKNRQASAISGGIFLISLGVLVFTGWWWPGIMFAIGLSGGAAAIFRGRIWAGIGTMAFFFAIPFVVWIIQAAEIPWAFVGPLVLIGVGVIIIVKAFFFRKG